MERYKLEAAPRTLLGKQKVKRLRREGLVPAVIYGRGMEPTPLQVQLDAFNQMVKEVGMNVLLDLAIAGSDEPATVVVKKIQRNPINGMLLNIDFHHVSATEAITSRIPVVLTGEASGVAKGGTLIQPTAEIDIHGVATILPASVSVDISKMEIGDMLHVSDLVLPEGVQVLTLAEDVIAAVHAQRAEAPAAEAAEAGEGEAAAE